ncbi:hypothetical protein HanHA89_Chr03g0086771 [Helianthus annuus]|nr:hypothetical protein HanHA89_Chr03g0086771 [Helianthus annuus]
MKYADNIVEELARKHTRSLLLVLQLWDEFCKKKHSNESSS